MGVKISPVDVNAARSYAESLAELAGIMGDIAGELSKRGIPEILIPWNQRQHDCLDVLMVTTGPCQANRHHPQPSRAFKKKARHKLEPAVDGELSQSPKGLIDRQCAIAGSKLQGQCSLLARDCSRSIRQKCLSVGKIPNNLLDRADLPLQPRRVANNPRLIPAVE